MSDDCIFNDLATLLLSLGMDRFDNVGNDILSFDGFLGALDLDLSSLIFRAGYHVRSCLAFQALNAFIAAFHAK